MNFFRRERPTPFPAPAATPPQAITPLDIIASLAQGVVAVGSDRKVLLCNEAMEPLLNRPPLETVGRPLWEVLRRREVGEALDRVLAGSPEEVHDLLLPGDASWRFRVRPLSAGAVITFTDLTAVRRLENVRKDFVANVSHELKTPLTSLRAALETLVDGAMDDPDHARDFLDTALHQVERLQRLIDDLLSLTRLEKSDAPAPGRASVHKTLHAVVAALRPLAEKRRVTLTETANSDDPTAAVTDDELTQVMTNLLDNAIKFNRPGGAVRVHAERLDTMTRITVEDTGVGIPAEEIPRIFERFYRVEKSRSTDAGGTGLGLAIVKHIVEKRAGRIRVDSVPGQGTTFTVDLPRA
jgi:two-component system phosphate regulon sensor histidine kinase PhoR